MALSLAGMQPGVRQLALHIHQQPRSRIEQARHAHQREWALVLWVVALAAKVLAVVWRIGRAPDHTIERVQRQALPAMATGLLVRPPCGRVPKQRLQGLAAQALTGLAQCTGTDGPIALPRQGQIQHLGHIQNRPVPEQCHAQHQPQGLLHGQAPFAQRSQRGPARRG